MDTNSTSNDKPRGWLMRADVGLSVAFVALVAALVLPGTLAGDQVLGLNFFLPYAAVAAIYVLLALWSIFSVDGTVGRLDAKADTRPDPRLRAQNARVVLGTVFVVLVVLLYCPLFGRDVGIGGAWGSRAIASIGSVILGVEAMEFATAVSNALAITIVAQLMWGCACVASAAMPAPTGKDPEAMTYEELKDAADAATRRAGGCQRAVVELLQAGAAFAFVSTTALFLFFSFAEEIDGRTQEPRVPATAVCSIAQDDPALRSWRVKCELPEPTTAKPPTKGRVAASMAFAVGVAFAAVLFVSLLTAGRAVDAAIVDAERAARAMPGTTSFSSADWRKQQGLPESSLVQSVIQAAALFAPTAAAGLAVLLKS